MKKAELIQKAVALIESLQQKFTEHDKLSPKQIQSALKLLGSLLVKLKVAKTSAFVATAFHNVGILLLNHKMFRDAVSALKNAVSVYKAHKLHDKVKDVQFLQGRAMYAIAKDNSKIHLVRSIPQFRQAIQVLETIPFHHNEEDQTTTPTDLKIQANVLHELAIIYTKLGFIQREVYEQTSYLEESSHSSSSSSSLSLSTPIQPQPSGTTEEVSGEYVNDAGDADESIETLTEAVARWTQVKHISLRSLSLYIPLLS